MYIWIYDGGGLMIEKIFFCFLGGFGLDGGMLGRMGKAGWR